MPRTQSFSNGVQRRAYSAVLSALALGLGLCLPASAAQSPMTAEEFEAYTTGKTLYFYSQGQAYGVEEYKENRRVTWSFLDGQCKDGTWYAEGDQICFVYEDAPTPQCWIFYQDGSGLRAVFEGRDTGTELYEAGEADEPMMCLGPEVGV